MRQQTETAIAAADAVMFLVDARAGVVPSDRVIAQLVRESGKPAILVANKCEGRAGQAGIYEAYALGLGRAGRRLGGARRGPGRSLRGAARGAARMRPSSPKPAR